MTYVCIRCGVFWVIGKQTEHPSGGICEKCWRQYLVMKAARNIITVVSGLPRSGTSMAMQMLEAGGMEIYTDGVREADENNPHGYFETEKVKSLIQGDDSWLGECYGKAVKVISPWLHKLPLTEKYKVIFMQRNLEAILDSQRRMLESKGKTSRRNDEELYRSFQRHLREVRARLGLYKFDVLYVRYESVLHNPGYYAGSISRFLDYGLDEDAMARVVVST